MIHSGATLSAKSMTVSIDASRHGHRLDRTLTDGMGSLSRSRIKSLIQSGCASVDDQTIEDPNFRVKQGSTIVLRIPNPTTDKPEPQALSLDIRYEDDHLIILNKPAGLVIHPAAGNPDRTLVNALLAHCGDTLSGIGGVKRPGIVHRLDKDTSGLLVAAKTEQAHHGLARQFASHNIERRYAALVWGVPSPLSGTIIGAIGRSSKNRKKMAVVTRGGKEAVTHYQVQETFGIVASMVECRLETGRTHQIRVHLSQNGNSVIGDPLYGRGLKRGIPDSVALAVKTFGRQALHAQVLGFVHPMTAEAVHFEASVPPDFQEVRKALHALK
jgi:23S rRNA pseudouridine1911/1915/1917 synthase